MTSVVELLANLRDQSLRNRVGLWLAPDRQLVQIVNEAARLGIDAQDIRQALLHRLPLGTRFAGLSGTRLADLLDSICEQPGYSDCVLVYNLDLLLAGLGYEDQQEIWRTLWQSFPHRQRALLLVMPQTAVHLLPRSYDLATWRRAGRLAGETVSLGE